jgi:serine/threonine-protein kinase
MSLPIGTRLGRYEVVSLVGTGGMGEVYRARDQRLGRDVAVKVLPAQMCQDPDRLRRFEQEARAIGALNHPNVLAVYDVDVSEGRPYLVSELLEGESLRERLNRGALPPRRAVEIAAQTAAGLAAAHACGIVHRDIKPENLFLTRDGRAKILDFGIAKLTQPDPEGIGETDTSAGQTAEGVVIGTAGYMSPEQVRGQRVDQRSDIFSFGAVLHEMLAGTRAFPGASSALAVHAVLELDPPGLPNAVPEPIRRVVRRCVDKDPDARFQSARDLAFALEGFTTDSDVTDRQATGTARRAPALGLVAVGVAFGVSASALAWFFAPTGPPETEPRPVRRFVFQPPAHAPLTLARTALAIAPSGTQLVYAADSTPPQLFLRPLTRLDATPLAGTENPLLPFFSPDGQWVGFEAGGRLKKVSILGGEPLTLAEVGSVGFLGASWGPDGQILFSRVGSGILRVSADGGAPVPLTAIDQAIEIDHHPPFERLSGPTVLFTVHAAVDTFHVAVRTPTGEQRMLIPNGFSARYLPTGHLVWSRDSALLAASFDRERLAITGPEVTLLDNLFSMPGGGVAPYAVADDGTLAYVPAPSRAGRTLVWVDRTGAVQPLALPPRAFDLPRISPDGRRVAVRVDDGQGGAIWIYRLEDGAASRLALDGRIADLAWTPDGNHITYGVRRRDESLLIRQRIDGTGPGEVLARSPRNHLLAGDWAPDGRALAFVDRPATGLSDIRIWRRPGEGVESFIAGPTAEGGPSFSPDGRWIAYHATDRFSTGRDAVYIRPFPGAGVPRQISIDGGEQPRWSPTGDEVFFWQGRRLIAVPVRTSPTLDVGPPRALFELPFAHAALAFDAPQGSPVWAVAPDGRRFLVVKPADEESTPRPIHIVENWFEELTARVRPSASQ